MTTRKLVGASTGSYVSKFTKKPDEKSHPDPLKRYAALKKWWAMKDKLSDSEVMKYEPKKTFDKVEKESKKPKEPQRGDFPKGKAGDIKYKVAYRKYLESIT